MNKYEKMKEIVFSLKPSPPIFNITSRGDIKNILRNNKRNSIRIVPVKEKRDRREVCGDEDVLYNFALCFFSEHFDSRKLTNVINYDPIVNNIFNSMYSTIVDSFVEHSDYANPKLTKVYRKLNSKHYNYIEDRAKGIIVSLWLYGIDHKLFSEGGEIGREPEEVHRKNLIGLISAVANRI